MTFRIKNILSLFWNVYTKLFYFQKINQFNTERGFPDRGGVLQFIRDYAVLDCFQNLLNLFLNIFLICVPSQQCL